MAKGLTAFRERLTFVLPLVEIERIINELRLTGLLQKPTPECEFKLSTVKISNSSVRVRLTWCWTWSAGSRIAPVTGNHQ